MFRTQRHLSGYATAKTLPTFPYGNNGCFKRLCHIGVFRRSSNPNGFRISNFEFRICRASTLRENFEFLVLSFEFPPTQHAGLVLPQQPRSTLCESPQSARRWRGGPRREGRIWQFARHSPGTRDLTVVATRGASSTVDAPQSASNAIYHSYPSERRGGRSPTWLSEGGRARKRARARARV